MKVAIVLLCALAAVQGRSVQPFDEALDAPYVVHLRVAKSTGGGFLDSCVGSLYNKRWVLTSAKCLQDARFVWIRYNAQNVFQPELVTETSRVTLHPEFDAETGDNNIALLDINRDITFTDTIQPVGVASSEDEIPSSGKACGYGELDGRAGEDMFCVEVDLEESEGLLIGSNERKATTYDLGAAVVSDGKIFGVLIQPGNDEVDGVFLKTSPYADWISEVTAEPEAEPIEMPVEEIQVAQPIAVEQIRVAALEY